MDVQIVLYLLLALWLWALVGMERWINEKSKPKRLNFMSFGDVRTFGLISFFGALTMFLSYYFYDMSFFTIGAILVWILVIIFYLLSSLRAKQYWMTTELSAIVTFFLWALVMMDYALMAVILSVILTFLLSLDTFVENLLKKISEEELQNTIVFAVIAIVVLPLLPDQAYSIADWVRLLGFTWEMSNSILNMDFFNPYWIWFFVVLMSWISYVWYIMSRFIGEKSSIMASWVIGWIASSTALTASMSEQSKKDLRNTDMYVVATLLASSIMFLRVIAIVLFFNINILPSIITPSLFMMWALIIYIVFFYARSRKKKESVKNLKSNDKFESPFKIKPAFKFAWIIIITKFIAWIGALYADVFWDKFFYLLWVISGWADADAVSQTMAVNAADWLISMEIAATTIIIAVMANNVVKWFMAVKFWEKKYGWAVMFWFIFSIVVGIIWLIIMRI